MSHSRLVYSRLQNWDLAFQKYEESLRIYNSLNNHFDHAVTLIDYGKALIEKGDVPKAEAHLRMALELFTKCESKDRVKEVEDLLHTLESAKQPG